VRILLFACTLLPLGWVYEPIHHLAGLHWHHVDTIWLQLCNAVGILVVHVTAKEIVHGSTVETLGLGHWTFLVCEE
jgi:hypothetical protein